MTPHFGFTDQRSGWRGSSFLLAEREESAEDSATSLLDSLHSNFFMLNLGVLSFTCRRKSVCIDSERRSQLD